MYAEFNEPATPYLHYFMDVIKRVILNEKIPIHKLKNVLFKCVRDMFAMKAETNKMPLEAVRIDEAHVWINDKFEPDKFSLYFYEKDQINIRVIAQYNVDPVKFINFDILFTKL